MPDNYEVILRDKRTGNRRSLMFSGTSFTDVEQQAIDASLTRKWFDPGNEEIIRIDREYEVDTHDEELRQIATEFITDERIL